MARADDQPSSDLRDRYLSTRHLTDALARPLSDADAVIQPHEDASPAKWHLAHTSWFFETFILRDHVADYRLHDERWPFLFNSYYEGEGERHARARRGMISRPSLDEVRAYRAHVDDALVEALPQLGEDVRALIALGIEHEQQHQELFLTDILAALHENPLDPAYGEGPPVATGEAAPMGWTRHEGGTVEIGHSGKGFSFDCERPRHARLVAPFELADRLVTQGDWARFMLDGGYSTPSLWLSDGWAWVTENGIEAPLYWRRDDGEWSRFTLAGRRPIEPSLPVTHVSYYEAEAYARWAGARLPREEEWEMAASNADPAAGHQLDEAGAVMPLGAGTMFGDCWQWTGSAYLPYPGFTPEEGTVGEYNGKFMCGQFVLKGASCATPRGHSRASYRNFFYPAQRWQFTGVRLARDA
ncbi:ergothioneine biosynthesis protein EgtB [Sphingomicrobium lutaoense]|uniref:Ergothioneine biosynthesis protein EgtB n=1 Tax=Sphingomicrobium lutaoense TaxID=515949 RepID=A0A839YWT9_9SPHN|nr:ergothioneine biosynthesis protein EgtB [Sphingomicrobium lutaoense]MBB3764671.1 ergothioneine biosynthesis protein EgtB [Sphingomicrobium lutaoense]